MSQTLDSNKEIEIISGTSQKPKFRIVHLSTSVCPKVGGGGGRC